ncbi:xylulokinase [Enterococcus sp.]|uniref:xylulokinase n=1 Tax=Enterococcus sp. TaxID=35783 RepID=UPI0029119C67|nr:xylulokinase [Enterococcus sp.]MDU5333991.1 xylulokinase [Enterococcus sp.]
MYLLGIDIGISSCKVALFTEDGEAIAQSTKSYPVFHPQEGWAEQDPDDWWQAVCQAIKELLSESKVKSEKIVGIGVDGQSWSAIPISNDGTLLRNTPIWMDTRAQEICDDLKHTLGEERLFAISGNPIQHSYTLPKVLWYRDHLPELYKQTAKILQSNSYIVYKLTGEITQDISQGYGYQCFDMKKGAWDRELCKEMNLREDILPEIAACHEIVGRVTKEAAQQSGLSAGIPVVAGGLDSACGTLGVGVIANGETQEQGGQAGGMSICTDEYRADKHLILSYHVTSKNWLLQGGTVGGGGVLKWFEEQFGQTERINAENNGTTNFEEMNLLAENIEAGSEGLVFLPYMAGERSPIWNPKAKGVYYGLDYSKTKGHMIRASMEGVAFSLKHNLDVAKQAGAEVSRLRAMGGSANSQLWTQIKSDVTNKPIDVLNSDTATTLGAAILAGVAVGVYKDFEDAVAKTVQIRRSHTPNPYNSEVYQKNYELYLKLYEQLKGVMK